MSTLLQQNLAKEIVNNVKAKRPKNKKQLVVSSGYSEITADRHATEVIEQKGVIEELENLGFSIDGAKKVVEEIMYDKKVKADARLKATDQVFKVHGSYNEKMGNTTNIIFMPPELLEKYGLKNNDTNTSPISNS